MATKLLIAHAKGEESRAEELAGPLREAGFEVAHQGTVLVGDSITGDASRLLGEGVPVVLCGTVRALGTKWASTVANTARQARGCRLFCAQMEEEADVERVAFDERVAEYWRDPAGAMSALVEAIRRVYPEDEAGKRLVVEDAAETRYRQLALESCDIIDLANLPESDRHIATRKLELRRLYVPLHVHVEARPEDELGEEGLRALEERRVAGLRSWSAVLEAQERERAPLGTRLTRRLVVLGDPGAGKTTLLRWLASAYLLRLKSDPDWHQLPAVETLPDEDWLPVIIRCRDLDPECAGGALDDFLAHTLRKAELTEDEAGALRALLRDRLEAGRALLLVDGLDEIADPGLRARFARQLEQVHVAFPRAPIVATSRIVGYREMGYRIGRGFEHVTVADLTKEEKDDFAHRWCELTELPERRKAAERELVQDIHSSDRIERLTGNPMLLTTLTLVKRKVGRLPSRRADLYWEALQVLLHWRREVDEPVDPREAVPQLEYLAYAMCDRGVQQLREDEVIELLDQMRGEFDRMHEVRRRSSAEFLRLLERRTGILVESGHSRHLGRLLPIYEFRHLTFQEYLAGLALVDGIYPGRDPKEELAEVVKRLAERTHTDFNRFGQSELVVAENWREAIRLCVVIAKYEDADEVLRAVLAASVPVDAGKAQRPQVVLAALCLADEPKVSPETAAEVLGSLTAAITDDDSWSRLSLQWAINELARSRWKEALEQELLNEYHNREPSQRLPVGRVLGETVKHTFVDQDAVVIKLQTLDWSVEGSDDIAILLFFGIWERSPDSAAILVDVALGALTRGPAVAHAALDLLSFVARGDPHLIAHETLLAGIRHNWADEGARLSGIELVQGLGLVEAAPEVRAELSSENPEVRVAAARALGELQDTFAVDTLIKQLQDEHVPTRRAVVGALGKIGGAHAVEALISMLSDGDAEIRRSVLGALAHIRADAVGRRLLSRDLDGFGPFLDPREPITFNHVQKAQKRLSLSEAEIRDRLRALAAEYGLVLEPDSIRDNDTVSGS